MAREKGGGQRRIRLKRCSCQASKDQLEAGAFVFDHHPTRGRELAKIQKWNSHHLEV